MNTALVGCSSIDNHNIHQVSTANPTSTHPDEHHHEQDVATKSTSTTRIMSATETASMQCSWQEGSAVRVDSEGHNESEYPNPNPLSPPQDADIPIGHQAPPTTTFFMHPHAPLPSQRDGGLFILARWKGYGR